MKSTRARYAEVEEEEEEEEVRKRPALSSNGDDEHLTSCLC